MTTALCGCASVAHADPPTGRLLVLARPAAHGAVASRARIADVQAVAARSRARLAGTQVPRLGLVTVKPARGESLHALAARLRRDPRVASVTLERRFSPRFVPTDPAYNLQLPGTGVPAGTTYEWWAPRENFPAAWDINDGSAATVAVIETGVDISHPELASRIVADINQDPDAGDGAVGTDPDGHGTHVASLACAASNNGIGLAGAGLGCHLVVEKSDFSDSSVAAAIMDATDRGVGAINMSFGSDGSQPAATVVVNALKYAYAHNVVLVAAAADQPVTEQGDPSNVLQPSNSGPILNQGLGLDVTAADFANNRASFAGLGTQISIAAYGAYGATGGPPGLLGAFPSTPTTLDTGTAGPPAQAACGCRTTFGTSTSYAYLQGTSMAAPQVAAAAALIRATNPGLTAADVITMLKQTATRQAGATGWTADLGWGILNAGSAVATARTIDRTPPVSHLTAPKHPKPGRITLRWTGTDTPPPGVVSSLIARYEVYRSIDGHVAKRFLTTNKQSTQVTVRSGHRYSFYTLAVDHSGNREAPPKLPDARLKLAHAHTVARKHRR